MEVIVDRDVFDIDIEIDNEQREEFRDLKYSFWFFDTLFYKLQNSKNNIHHSSTHVCEWGRYDQDIH